MDHQQQYPGSRPVLHSDERIDDLQYKGLLLIQKTSGFCFGLDAVLLANFVKLGEKESVIDLGTGTGIIPILLAGKTQSPKIVGLEIQEEIAKMAQRSVALNSLEVRVKIVNGDIKDIGSYFKPGEFDAVVSNPPYMKYGGGLVNPSDTKALSRHEIACTLEDVVGAATRLLPPGGQFAMVHRPERLVDIVWAMRSSGIEPKYLRFVHPSSGKKANLILIKGNKGGRPELKMMEPLYVYDSNGNYTEEINEIYGRQVNLGEPR